MNQKKPGRPKNTSKTKKCRKCSKTKSRKYFYATGPYCKKCQRKAVIENQKIKSEYFRAYREEYAKLNPDKAAAWKNTTLKRWEEKHGITYSEFALNRHRERLANDPEYREKINDRNKKYYQEKKEEKKAYREAYYTKNRELLLLKAKIRRVEEKILPATDDKKKKECAKRLKDLHRQIKKLGE